jgi:predicted ATPase
VSRRRRRPRHRTPPLRRPVEPARHSSFGVTEVRIRGFRTIRDVTFRPGPVAALVGEQATGKSSLLLAIRAVLDPSSSPLAPPDFGGGEEIFIRVAFADGSAATLEAQPGRAAIRMGSAPPMLFLPAEARTEALVAAGAGPAAEIFRRALEDASATPGSQARSVIDALEACRAEELRGVVLMIEEPEIYLRPQAQRYLYHLLRDFAAAGNQVVYSTHSPAFLNVARLDEVVFVERLPQAGTRTSQPPGPTADEDFRVMTEFDVARSELFLARAVVLVEGWTEKLVLPFVFASLGYDVDREAISIIECGGKPNLPLFAGICRAVGVPFVVVHDSDRKSSGRFVQAEAALNALVAETAGPERVIVLDPDFEAVAGLTGDRRKPRRAWREFADRPAASMPAELLRAAELTLSLL